MKTNGKSTTPNIAINVEYTHSDFVHAIRLMKASSVFRLLEKIFAAIFGLFASYYLYLTLNSDTQAAISAYLILLLFLMSLYLWIDVSVYLTAGRAYRLIQKKNIKNIEFKVDKQGISSNSNLSNTHSGWDNFVDSFENDKVFVIVLVTKNFLIFPKRFIATNENIESLRVFLYSNISSKSQ